MEDHKHQDSQSPSESTQNFGQVMDVTAPVKQIDVTDNSTDQAPAFGSNSSNQTADEPAVPAEAPQDTALGSETSQNDSGGTTETESTPATEESNSVDTSSESSATDPSVNSSNSEPSDSAISPGESNSDLPPADAHEGLAEPTHAHAKKGMPMVAIIIALIVAIGMAGLVIFAYMKNRDNGDIKRTDSTASSQTAIAEKPQASTTDVDSTTKEIDTSLQKADDTKDFATTDLSDTTLGL